MTKSELRKKYKMLRSELTPDTVDIMSIDIANNLLKLDIWNKNFYHIFLPITEQKEVNTEFILNILSGKDKNIIVSKSDFETFEMTHILLTDNTKFKKNSYNIPEPLDGIVIAPNSIDVVFVPLLAYDKHGNRVGYGKGFYDRFLSQCRDDVIKIGLSFFEAEDSIGNIKDTDMTLSYVISPDQILSLI